MIKKLKKDYIFFFTALFFLLQSLELFSQETIKLLPAEEIIKNALKVNVHVNKDIQTYMCSTRTSVLYTFDVKVDKYMSFSLIDDYTNGIIFWRYPDKFKYYVNEVLQNQTILDTIVTPFNLIRQNLTSTVNFDSFKIVSPLCDSCFKYYDYRIKSTVTVDRKMTAYDIEFTPKRNDIPCAVGTFRIEDENFTLLETDFTFNDKYKYHWIVESMGFRLKYLRYDGKFTLTEKIESFVKIKFPLIGSGQMLFTADFFDFFVNAEIDDYIFSGPKFDLSNARIKINDEAMTIDRLKSKILDEKRKQYERKFDRYIVKSGDISDYAGYNRVQGTSVGLGIISGKKISDNLQFYMKGGYGTKDNKWYYYGSADTKNLFNGKGVLKFSVYNTLSHNNDWIMTKGLNSIFSLLFKTDYMDYFYNRGWNVMFKFHPFQPLGFRLRYFYENHTSALKNTNFSIFSGSDEFRGNPQIEKGRYSGFSFQTHYNNRYGYLNKISGWSIFADITVTGNLFKKSSIKFKRYFLDITNFRYLKKNLSYELNLRYGYGSPNLPVQFGFANTVMPPFGFPKDMKYNYGNRMIYTDFSLFFGREILKKIKIPFYKLQFVAFCNFQSVYNNPIEGDIFKFPGSAWDKKFGIGIDEVNGIFQIRFTETSAAFYIKRIIPFHKYKD